MTTDFQPETGSYYAHYRERLISVVAGMPDDTQPHELSVETVEIIDRDLSKRAGRALWRHQNVENRLANEALADTVVLDNQ